MLDKFNISTRNKEVEFRGLPPLPSDLSCMNRIWSGYPNEHPIFTQESTFSPGLVKAIAQYQIFSRKAECSYPRSYGVDQVLRPYAKRIDKLYAYYGETMFGAQQFLKLYESPYFQYCIRLFWESNYPPEQEFNWRSLLWNDDFFAMAANFWEEYYGRHQVELRRQIIAAVDIFNGRKKINEWGQGDVDRVIEDDQKSPHPYDSSQLGLGLKLLMRLRVDEILERTQIPSFDLLSMQKEVDYARVNRNVDNFFKDHPQYLARIRMLKSQLPDCSINALESAIRFRLALYPYNPDHYDVPPVEDLCKNPFDEKRLKQNAIKSTQAFLESIFSDAEGEMETYLAEQTSVEVLWGARMNILFPSLKLAQRGARIDWGKGGGTERKLRLYLAHLNNILGEAWITVRQCGDHLNTQITAHRELTRRVAPNELYVNDHYYGKKVMGEFDHYTSSPDSFLVSVDLGPLQTRAEILISKIIDDPPTFTMEFLYIDKEYRRDHKWGTLVQNIAQSLVSHVPNARLVATVYSANENMPRHFKRGWVGTSIINAGKTIGLQMYEGLTRPLIKCLAEDHDQFVRLCERYLNQEECLLTDLESVPDSSHRKDPSLKPQALFPCWVTFGKTSPEKHFYRHDLP